jgi:hypothetical protein
MKRQERMGGSQQLSSPPETTTNSQQDGHDEPNNISVIKDGLDNYKDDCHDSNDHDDMVHDKEYETIRAEHKRVALEFQQELKEGRQRNKDLIALTWQKAHAASHRGNMYCRGVQGVITPHDDLYNKQLHKFYKAQDYFQQKRDGYFAKCDKLANSEIMATLKAYRERLESYLANVDSYSVQEDASEFSALLDAHEEVVPLRLEKDACVAELAIHARKFIQTVDLLVRWQLERHHYMAKPTEDINNVNVPHPTPVIMNFYHYR